MKKQNSQFCTKNGQLIAEKWSNSFTFIGNTMMQNAVELKEWMPGIITRMRMD